MCLIAWPLARVTRGGRPAAVVLAAFVAVSVPLSLAWNWQRQEFVWKRQAPTTVDCELFVAAEDDCRGWVSTAGRTPLMTAAVWGYNDVVHMLLEAGADPLLHDAEGKTARDWAEWTNKPETAALLREAEVAGGNSLPRR